MRYRLYGKFITTYVLIGIICFFIVTGGGSYLAERNLEHSLSEALYTEAVHIASFDTVKHRISSNNLSALNQMLSSLAVFQQTDIWVINSKNELILSTNEEISATAPIALRHFDPAEWGGNYYQIGKFYGHFKNDRLSVIAPITSDMTTKGYIAIHYPIQTLYQTRSAAVMIMQILFLVVYALVFLLVLLYRNHVQKPLYQIIQGTSEYANGNLAYQIPVDTDDEMGYLAHTLNFLSERLNKNGEYQRNFISNISHDFRSPLTSIKGYVEAILDGTIPVEVQEKYLKIIVYEAERLEKLTNSLRTLNDLDIKKRLLHIESFDINDMIKTTAATFEGICMERKILLELILSGKELYVKADIQQIQQVLYNLLDNAIKFSDNSSSIIIETTEKNGKVFVSVKDHGCGVAKENLNRIWERFYKIDSSRGKDRNGTGLGLSIVKEIIHAHGENINVISTEGVGTEFIFTLEKENKRG